MTVQAVRDALAVPKPKTEANDVRWKKWAAAQLVVQHHTPAALDSLEAERDAALDRCQLYGDALGAEENNSAALEAERDALKEDRTKIEARLAEVNDQRDEMQRQALVSLNRSDAAAARIRELEAEVERLQLRDRPAVLAMTEEWKAMETALAAAQEENERLAASLGTSVKTSLAQRTALREAEEENERLKADALTRSVREDEVDHWLHGRSRPARRAAQRSSPRQDQVHRQARSLETGMVGVAQQPLRGECAHLGRKLLDAINENGRGW